MRDRIIKGNVKPEVIDRSKIHSEYVEKMEKSINKRVRDYNANELIRKENYGIAHISNNFFILCAPNGDYIARIIGDEKFLSKLYSDYINRKIK